MKGRVLIALSALALVAAAPFDSKLNDDVGGFDSLKKEFTAQPVKISAGIVGTLGGGFLLLGCGIFASARAGRPIRDRQEKKQRLETLKSDSRQLSVDLAAHMKQLEENRLYSEVVRDLLPTQAKQRATDIVKMAKYLDLRIKQSLSEVNKTSLGTYDTGLALFNSVKDVLGDVSGSVAKLDELLMEVVKTRTACEEGFIALNKKLQEFKGRVAQLADCGYQIESTLSTQELRDFEIQVAQLSSRFAFCGVGASNECDAVLAEVKQLQTTLEHKVESLHQFLQQFE